MAKQQTKKRPKGARKKFFEADIPLTATKVQLYAYGPEDLVGNMVKIDLTKNLRGKNLELRSKVVLKGEKLVGELVSLQILPTYFKRVMRRGTDYVEDSFEVECKDAKLRIKPLMVTRKRVSRAVRNEIRSRARKHLEAKVKTRTVEELFSEIMTNKLQKELSLKIKKTYPLGLCEIRMLNVLGPVDAKAEDKAEETSKKKE